MPRRVYTQELRRLQDEMLVLGSMVEDAIEAAVSALKSRDREAARRIIAGDRDINRKRFAIEGDALTLIATQQPMASDLRTIAAVLEITTELERIGDYAKGTAKVILLMGDGPLLKPLVDIPRMADKACSMLRQALTAFVERDVDAARHIPSLDDEVDALYNQVYRELVSFIVSDPRTIDQANFLLWVAHNMERAADRVINVCERVVFTVTGVMEEMDVEEGTELGLEGVPG